VRHTEREKVGEIEREGGREREVERERGRETERKGQIQKGGRRDRKRQGGGERGGGAGGESERNSEGRGERGTESEGEREREGVCMCACVRHIKGYECIQMDMSIIAAVCCSVLQHVAMWCSVVQCSAA